jgi:aldose 1-epimerase
VTKLDTLAIASPDGDTVARFAPAAGMVCFSLEHRGVERLDQRGGLEAYVEHGSTMGIPLLYPWANRLAGLGYEAAGQHVDLPADPAQLHFDPGGLPIHGVAPGLMRWRATTTVAGDAIVGGLSWRRPELLALFPYRHEALIEVAITSGALTIAVTVSAGTRQPLPVSFGFHPYLTLPGDRDRCRLELPTGERLALDHRLLPTGERAPAPGQTSELSGADLDDAYAYATDEAQFKVTGPRGQIAVELIEGFRFGQVYSPDGSDFVCFEPMTAPGNALVTGRGLRVLKPRDSHRAGFRIAVSDASRQEGITS